MMILLLINSIILHQVGHFYFPQLGHYHIRVTGRENSCQREIARHPGGCVLTPDRISASTSPTCMEQGRLLIAVYCDMVTVYEQDYCL